ncbi:MAG: TonB-dependent receptor plug domain-containing protein, partial [Azoarcus sp.]|nr:TonB-dependent receptor plug domain-containing protein [Azoarcus sp.]
MKTISSLPAKRLLALILATLTGISTGALAQAQSADPQSASTGDEIVLPNITVTGAATSGGIGSTYYNPGNTDIIRSEVDVQPYTIIKRQEIENSGATTVEELLKQTLSMSTSVANDTASGWTGSSSQINLRGLGASQTLVLINGRRGAGVGSRGTS